MRIFSALIFSFLLAAAAIYIVVTGAVAIAYTLYGGILAVIWTDVVQSIAFIVGALAAAHDVIARVAIVGIVLFVASCGDSGTDNPYVDSTARSMAHMEYLSDEIGPRVAGQAGESEAAVYIRAQFLAMGYQPETQPFPASDDCQALG